MRVRNRGIIPTVETRRGRPSRRLPRRRLELEERREELLSAAFELFVARGYEAVGIDDVAKAAGASKGLVYHYFPTKKDLYRAAVERGAELLLVRTLPDPGLPPLERLAQGLDAYFQYVDEHEAAYAALMGSAVGIDPEIAKIVERTRQVIADRLIEGMPFGEPGPEVRAALRGWIGFVEALALHWIATRNPSRASLVAMALDVLQHAIVAALTKR